MKVYSKQILSLCVASLILGCGEGGSKSTPIGLDNSSNVAKEVVTLKGVAVDDLIVNGVVKVYSATTPRVLLAEGRTDPETGTYVLDIEYDGLVVLDVTADADSLMKNPDTGVTQPCESDLLLQSAAVVSPKIDKLEVNISPLTDLVVSQMEERGKESGGVLTQAHLEASQDNVGKIFGFDPLGESPVDNDSYKKTVSAIRALADKKDMTLVEVIAEINEDIVDGQSGDDGDIAKELAGMMAEEGVKNTFTENSGAVDPEEDKEADPKAVEVGDEEPDPKDDKEPDDPKDKEPKSDPVAVQKVDIDASKTFFKDLRTQAMSVVDYNGSGSAGFLDTESEALGQKVENMALNIDLVADYSMGIIGLITEAVDEGLDSKSIDMEDESDEVSVAVAESAETEKMMRKGGDPVVSRTLVVTKSADAKVWTYSMDENTTTSYIGTVTLPDANVSSITASNFTALTAKFDGSLPLRYMDSTESVGEQTVKLDLEVTKSALGADLELKEVSIVNGSDSLAIKTLKGKVEYDHDADSDEVTMKSVELETITLKATVEGYLLDGKLDVTEYVTNSSIASRGFEDGTVDYETRISGEVRCIGEHNEENEMSNQGNMDGNVIYTDVLGVEHSTFIESHGYFRKYIEGNVQNLADRERVDENIWDNNEMDGEGNYTNYLGLSFDNISLSSDSCSNILLEDVEIHTFDDNNPDVDSNRTDVNIRIFCVNEEGERSEISDASGTFTDATGATHSFSNGDSSELYTPNWEGNTEGIVLDSGHNWFNIQGGETFDRIAISNVNSECTNPQLTYVDISVNREDRGDGEQLYTHVNGDIICDEGVNPTQATVVYTDKAGQTYNLGYQDMGDEGFFGISEGESAEIIGNVEELEINSGNENYRAIGNTLPATPMFSVQGSTCLNPTFEQYSISLDSNENGDIYNSGVLPKKAKFVGSIKNTVTSGEINGELNVEWKNAGDMNLTDNSDAKAELDVSLQGKIKMPSRPEMILNLGFKNPQIQTFASPGGWSTTITNNYNLSYQYGTTALNGTASFDENLSNGTAEFTGTNGIKLVVKKESDEIQYGAKSPVTRNGRKIGELQDRAGVPVIKYVDGSFESLP